MARLLSKLVLWIGLLLAFAFVWQQAPAMGWSWSTLQGWTIWGIPLVLCIWGLAVAAWREMLVAFTGASFRWRQAAYQLGLLSTGKYIPGGVAGFLARAYDGDLGGVHGITRTSYVAAGLAEQIGGLALTTMLGLVLYAVALHRWWPMLGLIPALPLIMAQVARAVSATPGRLGDSRWFRYISMLKAPTPNFGPLALSYGLTLAILLLWAIAVGTLTFERAGAGADIALGAAAAYCLAAAVGMAVVIAPSGIGAREAAFALLVAPWMEMTEALAVAGVMRLMSTFMDLTAGALGLLAHRRFPPRQQEVNGKMRIPIKTLVARWLPLFGFSSSGEYWKKRYRLGGDSGTGSGGIAAGYKASVLNAFVRRNRVQTLIEFGCGDGRQLSLAEYPEYLGIDISTDAVLRCRAIFEGDPGKTFLTLDDYSGEKAEVALSLDVLFHLTEDRIYYEYLDRLFDAATRYVVIYSSNERRRVTLPHVRHRSVATDVARRFPYFRKIEEQEHLLPTSRQMFGMQMEFLIYEAPRN